MWAKEEESHRQQSENLSTSFDVNLFLRKTLSDFSEKDSIVPSRSPQLTATTSKYRKRQASPKNRDRRKLNRNLLDDTSDRMIASTSYPELAGNSGYPVHARDSFHSEAEHLLIPSQVYEDDSLNVHTVTPAEISSAEMHPSISAGSLNYGKLRSQSKKITPCPSRASLVSASSLRPLCRICHLGGDPQGSGDDKLISPCRCSGTMQFVHTACLVHWLEISTKKMCPTPHCELCGYEYKTNSCLMFQRLRLPRCSHQDKILHLVFVMVLLAMIGCAGLSVLYLQSDGGHRLRTSLNHEDIIVIICSVLFFCSFFVAVFTQYRAEASLCRLLFRCWLINEHWRIKNYDRKEDLEWKLAHQILI